MKLDNADKIFAAYLAALFIFLFLTFQYNSLISDEGTHLMLSAFYKDLMTNVAQTGDFSFQHAYRFGINYLVRYPKLQIAYPPLYHLTNAAAFSIFGLSETVARSVNLLYATGSFALFYLIVKKYLSARAALLSAILFSFSPLTLFFSSRALQDFSMFFFLLLSAYIFSFAIRRAGEVSRRSVLLFALAGFTAFLAAMGKQTGGIVAIFFMAVLAYKFLRQKSGRRQIAANSAALLFAFLIPLAPYLLALNAVGGFEINRIVAVDYGGYQGEPTSLADPLFWLWYPINALLIMPLTPLFLLAFAWLVFRKQNQWKPMLLWFSIFFVLLTLIPNKEPRFYQIFFLPVYAAAGFCLERILSSKKIQIRLLAPLFFVAYFAVSLLFFIPTVQYYPSKEIAQQAFRSLPSGANIALFSEADPLFSSAVMWNVRTLDNEKSAAIYRSCAFGNETAGEILQTLKENNIYSIIYQTWSPDARIEGIRPYLNLENTVTKNNLTTEIYSVKNFSETGQEKLCNYVCLTGQKICAS